MNQDIPICLPHRDLVEKLIYVLDSKSKDASNALTKNLLTFYRLAQADESSGFETESEIGRATTRAPFSVTAARDLAGAPDLPDGCGPNFRRIT
jgi:hypothetical protein